MPVAARVVVDAIVTAGVIEVCVVARVVGVVVGVTAHSVTGSTSADPLPVPSCPAHVVVTFVAVEMA